ncbi:MAG TPA: hypothetical protein VFE47_31030 [Tepidisphaeraceae bacterium]|jgi:anti-sigma factor RsiW|nr:hypothetical protein [Tepidisphaeraceae bacterium]
MQDLEFTISQYLDGTLPPADRLALEQELQANADARAMLGEYRKLDMALKAMLPMPAIPWDRLQQSISAQVAEAHEEQTARAYRMPAWMRRSVMPLALAASLLIVAGVGIQIYNNSRQTPTGWEKSGTTAPVSTGSSTFVAFQTDQVAGPGQADVSIGPGAQASNGSVVISYGVGPAAPAPSHVTIVSGGMPAHDTQSAAYFDMQ